MSQGAAPKGVPLPPVYEVMLYASRAAATDGSPPDKISPPLPSQQRALRLAAYCLGGLRPGPLGVDKWAVARCRSRNGKWQVVLAVEEV